MKKKKTSAHERMKSKMKESKVESKWLSVADAAAYLGISYVTIYRLVELDKIPSYRIGKLWKFKVNDLDRWVESGESGEV